MVGTTLLPFFFLPLGAVARAGIVSGGVVETAAAAEIASYLLSPRRQKPDPEAAEKLDSS